MKYFYPLLLLLSCLPAGAQSLYEKYERFLTTPRTYVCYRADGKLKMDGKLNESSWQKAEATAPFVDISGEGFMRQRPKCFGMTIICILVPFLKKKI